MGFNIRKTGVLFAMGAVLLFAGAAKADAVADFYKGKSITLYIGYSSGGGYDTYARTIARHMGKHIPGNPSIVPKNRPGAGSLVLTNEVAKTLKKDGTEMATIGRALVLEPLYGNKKAQFDPTKFTWLGSANNEVSVCVAWKTTPVKSVEDMKTRGMIVGGTGPGADTDTMPRILNNVLGTKLKLVTGYPGGNDVLLAMERGEVEGRCGYSYSSLKSRRGKWLKDGSVNILLQMSTAKHPEMPNVPFIMDLAPSDRDREVLTMNFAAQAMGRPYVAPPGVPADRAAALQKAFMDTMADPAFVADMTKQRLAVAPVSGPDILKLVKGMYSQPKELVEAAANAKSSSKKTKISKVEIKFEKEKGKITALKKGNRRVVYDMGGGKTNEVKISGSRTKIKIGGKKAKRKAFKVGMSCTITYPSGSKKGDTEAKTVSCK